jgi:tetratricopeptide (TPR) repeat protein
MYSLLNRNDEARTAYQELLKIEPQIFTPMYCLARVERMAGNQERSAELIRQARPLLPADRFYHRACLESIAGNANVAVEALRMALEHKEVDVDWARDDPDFVFIRDDPRYRALVGLDDVAVR